MLELFLLSLSKRPVWEFSAFHINGTGKTGFALQSLLVFCALLSLLLTHQAEVSELN